MNSRLSTAIFEFQETPVRIVDRDAQPWFVAADVCRVLELANSRDAISALDEDEKGVANSDTLGGNQNLNVISESGLYALIFKSRKPQAKAFRKWVTSEVLPAIRREGRYDMASGLERVVLSLELTISEVADGRCALDKARVMASLAAEYFRGRFRLDGLPKPSTALPVQAPATASAAEFCAECVEETDDDSALTAADWFAAYSRWCAASGRKSRFSEPDSFVRAALDANPHFRARRERKGSSKSRAVTYRGPRIRTLDF